MDALLMTRSGLPTNLDCTFCTRKLHVCTLTSVTVW